jgi:branched-chain amino acid transport system ATP-binding protein
MLSVKNLQVAYGTVQVIWDVSFEVPKGEIVAMIGANGAGKTTTLLTLAGLLNPKGGEIALDGETLGRVGPMDIVHHGIALVPEGRRLFPDMSVLDNLLMGAYSTPKAGREERLEKVFTIFPMVRERQKQMAGTLSGGEQQMVAIGRGLMADPRILMLDEPSLGLAPLMVEEVFRVIQEINADGVTVLLVEQNTQHTLKIAQRGYVVEAGRTILSGTGQELLDNDDVRRAYLGL